MKRLQKELLGAAVCCILFAIGCVIYTEFDKKRFEESLPQLPPTAEQSVHTERDAGLQNQAGPKALDNGIATTENPSDDYDWQIDGMNTPTGKRLTTDPWTEWWEQIEVEAPETEFLEEAEPYPPKGWHRTTDPVLFAEYYRAQLTNQFGDLPQVDILADGYMKIKAEIPMTLDEKLEHVEAMYDLFPDERTRETITFLKEWKASGRPFKMEFGPPPKPMDEFLDIKPFVERYGWEDGISKFRQINPARAAEFERTTNLHSHPH